MLRHTPTPLPRVGIRCLCRALRPSRFVTTTPDGFFRCLACLAKSAPCQDGKVPPWHFTLDMSQQLRFFFLWERERITSASVRARRGRAPRPLGVGMGRGGPPVAAAAAAPLLHSSLSDPRRPPVLSSLCSLCLRGRLVTYGYVLCLWNNPARIIRFDNRASDATGR